MNYEFISAVIVYSIIFFIIYKKRDKFQIMDKIFFVYKTKSIIKTLKKIASCTWFWKIFSTIGIIFCFFFILFSINLFIQGSIIILESINPEPTITLLIPGITKDPLTGKAMPIFDLIIILGIIIIIHESMHGIIGISEKIKINSVGVGLLAIIPLAFVEPDQKSYESSKKISKIRMLIAGSFGNLLFGAMIFLISVYIISPIISSNIFYSGLFILDSENNLSLPANVTLYSIGDYETKNISGLYSALSIIPINETINITTSEGVFTVKTMQNPNNPNMSYLGIIVKSEWDFSPELSEIQILITKILIRLTQFLNLLANLSISIGIINLFPLWITDGGKVTIEIIEIITKNKEKTFKIANSIFIICLTLLLFNLLGAYIINGLNFIGLL